ncbi:hypothetical protein BJY04DRAFT_219703 [Aspergillus karnatakaensis]|uniref:sulfotransferase family protein n=1 Tax=Aspergillus karnatakaensis TaxID=1810916 RepID=UPI003CCCC662
MGQQASTPQPGKTIRVIGAGLSRTGTASFSAALEILLNGPVYHGGTQATLGAPEHIKSWIQIIRLWLSITPEDQKAMFTLMANRLDGYVAITDSQAATWEKSMDRIAGLATLWFLRGVLLPLPGMRHFVEYIEAMAAQWERLYGARRPSIAIYNRHVEWLKEVVPADRLVIFDVKEGWAPLCRALGMEVPQDIPFPRINDSEAIERAATYHIQRGLGRWALAGTIAALGVAAFWVRA